MNVEKETSRSWKVLLVQQKVVRTEVEEEELVEEVELRVGGNCLEEEMIRREEEVYSSKV